MKGHIKLLHEFNEVRDVGLGLIGFFSFPFHASLGLVVIGRTNGAWACRKRDGC